MKKDRFLKIMLFILILLMGLFVIYPLAHLLKDSLFSRGVFSLDIYSDLFAGKRFRKAMLNSLILGVSSATASTAVGFLFAYSCRRIAIRNRGLFELTAVLPLISPPFMFALSVILLFGRNGLISSALLGLDTLAIYGFGGLLLVQTVNLFPIAFLTISSTIQSNNPDLELGAMNLGAKRAEVFFTVTLPLALPSIAASWLLIFVSSITDFGNPIILGGDFNVLSVQAYLEFSGMGNLPRGTALAVLLLIPSMGVFYIQKKILSERRFITVTGRNRQVKVPLLSKGASRLIYLVLIAITLFVLLIFGTILIGSFVRLWGADWSLTLDHYSYSYDVGFRTLRNTLILALISTPITAGLGVFIAWLRERKRLSGSRFLEVLSILGYAIPGTAVGIGYILAFNKSPFRLSGTAFILIAVYVFRNIPIGVESGIAALKQISPHIEESSASLGAKDNQTLRKITLPLIMNSFYSGAAYAFIRSMTAISAVIFLISARWNHLSVLILAQTEIMRLGAASAMSFTLIFIVLLFLLCLSRLSGIRHKDLIGII